MENAIIDGRYLKIIEKNNKYFFAIYSINNKNQKIGVSREFDNFGDCRKVSEKFTVWVDEGLIDSDNSFRAVCEETQNNDIWYSQYVYYDSENTPVFYQRRREGKRNSNNSTKALRNAIIKHYGRG